jgi:hypothetical protein
MYLPLMQFDNSTNFRCEPIVLGIGGNRTDLIRNGDLISNIWILLNEPDDNLTVTVRWVDLCDRETFSTERLSNTNIYKVKFDCLINCCIPYGKIEINTTSKCNDILLNYIYLNGKFISEYSSSKVLERDSNELRQKVSKLNAFIPNFIKQSKNSKIINLEELTSLETTENCDNVIINLPEFKKRLNLQINKYDVMEINSEWLEAIKSNYILCKKFSASKLGNVTIRSY